MPDLLFLAHRLPYPPDKGEKIRAWHVLAHLAQRYRVHLGCLVDDPADLAWLGELRRACARVGSFEVTRHKQLLRALSGFRRGKPLTADLFYHSGLARWVDDTLASYPIDVLYTFSSAMAVYAEGRRPRAAILDMVDVDSEKWRRYAASCGWPLRAVYRHEAKTLLAFERQAALAFDATLFVSEAEAAHFAALAPECAGRVGWLENGVDLERFSPAQRFAPPFAGGAVNIVFTGTMDYWPNVDAVTWFARRVMPLLANGARPVHFHIVGARPTPAVRRLERGPRIHVAGRVPDVRPYLAHADAVVAPLRIARGIQNKVLEAMAMGRPVVATPEAFEGLRASPGRDLLVRDGAAETAQALTEIFAGRHSGLGSAARAVVVRNYRWPQVLRRLDDLLMPLPQPAAAVMA